ncbi:MAG TPA: TRAP transporter small permease subunit [Thioploca sp.]|nr:MAG: C4-dicarboxylate ABC transporter permease [Gammaproteobacteria bacterium]HDN27240.1 TRAP transporter small permease subunit [Thioploca sp.]
MPSQFFLVSLKNIIRTINALSEWTGRLIAWLVLLMVLIIVYQASMVALFSIGSVALQELQWHLFALVFLLGAAYTLKHDDHVRVDIVYQSRWMDDRGRAWIDFLGGLIFLIPFCLLVITASWQFVYNAFATCKGYSDSGELRGLWAFVYQTSITCEGSPDPGGLPYRFLLKAAIPVGFALLMLQAIANSLSSLLYLLEHQEGKP